MKRSLFVGIVSAFAVSFASAGVTAIGQFSGTYSEDFESFNNYADGPFYIADPSAMMGGIASYSNPNTVIYQPGYANFGLGTMSAGVSDGKQGLGINESLSRERGGSNVATVTFSTLLSEFGAFWGAANYSPYYTGDTTVEFYDSSNALIDSVTFNFVPTDGDGDGYADLDWHGWSSTVGVKKIAIISDYTVSDGWQGNTLGTIVPVPGAGLLGMLGLALARRRS